MFGLLNPGRQDRVFRRAYSRCCQHQRRRYGLPSLAFLSYESVLLYLCAVDAGKVRLDELPEQACCRLRRVRGKPSIDEQEVARFCNSFGLLLAYIKLSDDVRDGPSLLARFASWLLRGRFRETFDYFHRLDPDFEQKVNAFVAEHVALERLGQSVALDVYVQPTAHAFGCVFSLMSRLPGLENLTADLEALGRRVGTAIIAHDCAVDWHRDQRRGAFNPLPDGEESVCAALALAKRTLRHAAAEWRGQLGQSSHVGRVLEQVARRLPGSCEKPACQRLPNEVETQLQRWGMGQQRKGFQLNEGMSVVVGLCAFSLVLLGGAACCVTSARQRESDRLKESDVPPSGTVPGDQVDAAAQTAAASSSRTGRKKSDCDVCCCDCVVLPGDADCGGCAGCEGCGEIGNACDGCQGCDCST